eukprot:1370411-Alexandrium_andersonii.AAC.1
MSASLVGSEMCIRDSSRSCRNSFRRPAACRRPAESRCSRSAGVPGCKTPCLLYTSDAADDM